MSHLQHWGTFLPLQPMQPTQLQQLQVSLLANLQGMLLG
jgi:hypothetical protein